MLDWGRIYGLAARIQGPHELRLGRHWFRTKYNYHVIGHFLALLKPLALPRLQEILPVLEQ